MVTRSMPFPGWLWPLESHRQLNQTASELAFHRSRVARGIIAADARERELAYQRALEDLLAAARN